MYCSLSAVTLLQGKIVDLFEKTLRPDWKKGRIGKVKEMVKRNRTTLLELTACLKATKKLQIKKC